MSKKLFALIVSCVGGVAAIASALVTYFQPPMATAINTAIQIAVTATADICILFVANEVAKKA